MNRFADTVALVTGGTSGMQPSAQTPPRYKLALLKWAGAYAVITLILAVLGPAMAAWPLPLRTLLLSAMMVPTLTWLVIPTLSRLFRGWLAAAPAHSLPSISRAIPSRMRSRPNS
jgi:antibiotic biosynthesis monooxygenase (ABM) superfamily enzyme